MSDTRVILRQTRDASGTRYLAASMNAAGAIVIEGHDLGDGVEEVFGCREYEWTWTVPARQVAKLFVALGCETDVLEALGRRFSGNEASLLQAFLDSNFIEYEVWSRTGD